MFCQLETLRQCLPPSVRRTLDELPESLDETYERVLREIRRPNRDHALRLLQCLVVAIRPLDVKELAEVLAVDFDNAERIPKLKPDWRWEDEEQALLTSCSSLITTVETDDSRIVQFSHFSVKEYLTSERIATSNEDVSRYHIDLEPAHTILAQACISVLLQSDDRVKENDVREMSPLAGYAARHWVTHAQFETVSSFLRKAMEYLFDLDKPYFSAWVQLHDIDIRPDVESSSLFPFAVEKKFGATPLYYAALCGFQDLVEHLIIKYPQHVNNRGGYYVSPLAAALAGRHFRTAKLLHRDGAHVDICGNIKRTPLGSAAYYGDLEMVQILLDYKADVNARNHFNWTPIHFLSCGSRSRIAHLNIPQLWPDVARLLLEHGADVNARMNGGKTPLHWAGTVEVVLVLLEHGAIVGAEDNGGRTPLHSAVTDGQVEVVRVLLELGANIGAVDSEGRTPLHNATRYGNVEIVRMLLEHGTNVGAVDNEGRTPLHNAAEDGRLEVVRVLLEHGANIGAVDNKGRTPLHNATEDGRLEVVRVLSLLGANIGTVDSEGRTPLHLVATKWDVKAVRLLIKLSANIHAVDNEGRTPLHLAARYGNVKIGHVLLEHGANVDAADDDGRTPLHNAAEDGQVEVVRVLLEHGANIGAVDNEGRTPLHKAADCNKLPGSGYGGVEVVRVLLEHGANVDAVDKEGKTSFQIASAKKDGKVMRLLLP